MLPQPAAQPQTQLCGSGHADPGFGRARFVRGLPTGSASLYALEFQTSRGQVYALWTVRGTRAAVLRFADATRFTVNDLMGREREMSAPRPKSGEASAPLTIRTGPVFLRSDQPLLRVLPGESRFPDDKVPEHLTIVNRMDRVSEWEIVSVPDERLERPCASNSYLPFRTLGQFETKKAGDTEGGACLEVKLIPAKEVPDMVSEYAFLRLKNPVKVSGEPRSVGLWVKGNSGWGLVMWEFTDCAR